MRQTQVEHLHMVNYRKSIIMFYMFKYSEIGEVIRGRYTAINTRVLKIFNDMETFIMHQNGMQYAGDGYGSVITVRHNP